jgi:predicted DNA-binding protein (MmcQ/YjbR family)
MTIDAVRTICRALPGVTEDIKWGSDLVFSVGGKMFTVVNTEPPNEVKFKCTPEMFAELIERDGIIPAQYMARAMWVQERSVGEALERRELEALIKTSYELVVAKLPKSKRPTAAAQSPSRKRPSKRSRGGARRSVRGGR